MVIRVNSKLDVKPPHVFKLVHFEALERWEIH